MCESFNLKHCRYALNENKKTTSRSILCKDFKVKYTYTLESSFFNFK